MPSFLLHHQHAPAECAAAFAAWWRVEAADAQEALELLPPYVAHRTDVLDVRDVEIP